jgi:hypothetical protein
MSCTIKMDVSRPSRMPFNSKASTIEQVYASKCCLRAGNPTVRRDHEGHIIKKVFVYVTDTGGVWFYYITLRPGG